MMSSEAENRNVYFQHEWFRLFVVYDGHNAMCFLIVHGAHEQNCDVVFCIARAAALNWINRTNQKCGNIFKM